jgi:hypothetical protein
MMAAVSPASAVKGENAAAAATSLIVAAFTPQRWLFPCLLPHFMAQNSQFGGASRVCRHAIRRQIRHFRHNLTLLFPSHIVI